MHRECVPLTRVCTHTQLYSEYTATLDHCYTDSMNLRFLITQLTVAELEA